MKSFSVVFDTYGGVIEAGDKRLVRTEAVARREPGARRLGSTEITPPGIK